MMLYCCDCDSCFDASDARERRECVGEFWGAPAYETYMECPYCGSDSLIDENDDEFPSDDEEFKRLNKEHQRNLLKGMRMVQQMRRDDAISDMAKKYAEKISESQKHYSRNPLDDFNFDT